MKKKEFYSDILPVAIMCGCSFALGVLNYRGKPINGLLPNGIYQVKAGYIWHHGRCYNLPKESEIKTSTNLGEEMFASITRGKSEGAKFPKIIRQAMDFADANDMGLPYNNEIIVKRGGKYYYFTLNGARGTPLSSKRLPAGAYRPNNGYVYQADKVYNLPRICSEERTLMRANEPTKRYVLSILFRSETPVRRNSFDDADQLAIKYFDRFGTSGVNEFIIIKTVAGKFYRYEFDIGVG